MRVTSSAAVLVAVASGAASGFALGLTDGSLRDWLVVFGGSYEIASILLIASPELAPQLVRARTAGRAAAGRVGRWLRRVLRIRRTITASVGMAGVGAMSGGVRSFVSVREGATLEEKVEFLLRRDRDTQHGLADVNERLTETIAAVRGEIEAAKEDARAYARERIRETEGRYIGYRLTGVAILVLGIALATLGNLV